MGWVTVAYRGSDWNERPIAVRRRTNPRETTATEDFLEEGRLRGLRAVFFKSVIINVEGSTKLLVIIFAVSFFFPFLFFS